MVLIYEQEYGNRPIANRTKLYLGLFKNVNKVPKKQLVKGVL